jgi:GNAT superfamily N-acetyltransferase
MGDRISIRAAQTADARAISELTTQLGYDVPPSTVADRLGRLGGRGDQQFLVAEMDEDVVGWIHVVTIEYIETGAFGVVGGLVVHRNCRKHGVGRALMARAEDWVRGHGCNLMRVWSSAMRTEAHRFYEHLGYANVKTQYTFVKPLDPGARDAIRGFVPRVTS